MILTVIIIPFTSLFAQSSGEPGKGDDGPNPLKNVYFGEQHMHTKNSFDAFTNGSGTWEDAYRYAMSEVIHHPTTDEEIKRVTP